MKTFYLSIFVFALIVISQSSVRKYIAEEDYFRGFKAREFSIYCPERKTLHYRIESSWSYRYSIRLVVYPSKKTIGKLTASKKSKLFQGNFKLRNETTKSWSSGKIEQQHRRFGQNWTISWNETKFSMLTEPASFLTTFHDLEANQTAVGKFRLRLQSLLWVNVYDIEFNGTHESDSIFLLSFALKDHASQWKETH